MSVLFIELILRIDEPARLSYILTTKHNKKDWQSEYLEAIGAVHQRTFINNLFYRKLKTRIRIKPVAIAFVEFQIPSVR